LEPNGPPGDLKAALAQSLEDAWHLGKKLPHVQLTTYARSQLSGLKWRSRYIRPGRSPAIPLGRATVASTQTSAGWRGSYPLEASRATVASGQFFALKSVKKVPAGKLPPWRTIFPPTAKANTKDSPASLLLFFPSSLLSLNPYLPNHERFLPQWQRVSLHSQVLAIPSLRLHAHHKLPRDSIRVLRFCHFCS
jgi:hypothetical protein